jgi:hypothetical protein
MKYKVPGSERHFEIPDEWWKSAGMSDFSPKGDHYTLSSSAIFEVVSVEEIEPPTRNGDFWFRNAESVIEVLRKIRTGEELDPLEVWSKEKKRSKRYHVKDGFHRFYLSVAVGYPKIPIKVNDFDLAEFLAKELNSC